MLVCHCRVVTDRDILHAIAAGAVDEFDVAESCGAGTGCGGCVPTVTALLRAQARAPGCRLAEASPAAASARGG